MRPHALMMYFRNAFYIRRNIRQHFWHAQDTPIICECGAFWIVRGL